MADQVVQDIKDRLNVVELIAGYITVKKSGANFKAVCPFHNEKTPSLMISSQKQIWHCFGCGEGGDVFGFVMRYENLDFREALQFLANKAGVQLPALRPENKAAQDASGELVRINTYAAAVYHRILTTQQEGRQALKYLQERGLSEATIKQWQIGFAPNQFHYLENALAKKQVGLDKLVAAGVSAKNDRGQVYDRFRNRITFPIFNYYGEVVGFSARAMPGDDQGAKYLNSPDTTVYNKSKILFGLNFAKEAIRKKNEAVVVEGQMDCIQPHQAGFANTVASSGTALTEHQITMLGRLTKNLKFCFDADSAGSTAMRRAGELALRMGFQVKVIVLRQVKDPDELVRKGAGLWQKAVNEAIWFVDFYLEQALANYEAGSVEQKQYISREIMPLLSYIADPLEQDHYIHQLAERFGIAERVIREAVRQAKTGVQPIKAAGKLSKSGPAINPLEKQVLGALVQFPVFLDLARTEGLPLESINSALRPLYSQVLTAGPAALAVENPLAKEALFMVESELDQFENNEALYLRQLEKNFYLLKLNYTKQLLQDLTRKVAQAESSEDNSALDQLHRQFAELTASRLRLENRI